jgi:hypothetical protein
VLVTGLKWISDAFSVPFPQYMPLMVLHDPPGGEHIVLVNDQLVLRVVNRSQHGIVRQRPGHIGYQHHIVLSKHASWQT